MHRYRDGSFEISDSADQVPRIDISTTTHSSFIKEYELPGLPCVITGIVDSWNAKDWTFDSLLQRHYNEKLKVGETNDGDVVYMSLLEYAWYLDHDAIKDDSPLYVFDSLFGDRKKGNTADTIKKRKGSEEEDRFVKKYRANSPQNDTHTWTPKLNQSSDPLNLLTLDFSPPIYFANDLFAYAGEHSRPPYRWFVMGPARAGTFIHVDPLGTSAWNALIQGRKRYVLKSLKNRWVLFPPGTPKSLIDPCNLFDREAATWFDQVYPRLKKQSLQFVDLVQKAGETVFVPGGWAHVVMNLDFSIAMTQNFCSPTGLEQCYLKARSDRPRFSVKWRQRLPQKYRDRLSGLDSVPLLPRGSSSSSSSSSTDTEDTS